MTFLAPTRLWLLVAVAAVVVLYVVLQGRRRSYAVRFTNLDLLASVAPRRPGWRRHLPAALFLVALGAVSVAWARPATEVEVPDERATVILTIDVSLSMEATDIHPNRLVAAQQAGREFLEVAPAELNVGIVTFAGSTSVLLPPTTDRDAAHAALDRLELGPRTAIGEAIFTSLDAIGLRHTGDDEEPPPATVVLMSDGDTNYGRPNEVAAAAAREEGVPVTTIAFGTDGGTIRLSDEPTPIPVPVNREALQDIAAMTGGEYHSAVTAAELEDIYASIGSQVGFTTEEEEITGWFIGAAMLLLLATGAFSLAWFARLP